MRLIDADETYKVLIDVYHIRTSLQHLALKEALARVSTIDAVQVVRCKDCKYCNDEYEDCYFEIFVKPDGYCSYGEKKDETD